jgi:hypothetical protein
MKEREREREGDSRGIFAQREQIAVLFAFAGSALPESISIRGRRNAPILTRKKNYPLRHLIASLSLSAKKKRYQR